MSAARRLRHGAVALALHALRDGAGLPTLLLHGLGRSSADWSAAPEVLDALPGPAHALDFAGHGASAWRIGGAYTPELFAADADAALAAIGPCALIGAGLGAYVALLLAGARAQQVRAALLLPGPGLDGGGALPDARTLEERSRRLAAAGVERGARRTDGDPLVAWCAEDLRPVEYARSFGVAARHVVLLDDGSPRPPWWTALGDLPAVERSALPASEAVARLAALLEREAAR